MAQAPNPTKIRQAGGRNQQNHPQRSQWQILQRRHQPEGHHGNRQSRDHRDHLAHTARSIIDRRARVGTADGKSLGKSRRQVGQPQGSALLIGIDLVPALGGEAARGQHHADKTDQRQVQGGQHQLSKQGWRKIKPLHARFTAGDRAQSVDAPPRQIHQRADQDAEQQGQQGRRPSGSPAANDHHAQQGQQAENHRWPVDLRDRLRDMQQPFDQPALRKLEPEDSRQLSHHDGDRHPIEQPHQDGLRQKIHQGAETQPTAHQAPDPGHQRQHHDQLAMPDGIPCRQRRDHGGDDGTGRGIRADHQLAG